MKGQIIAQRWQLQKSTVDVPEARMPAAESEWYRVELRCEGPRAAVFINGVQVITLAGLDALGGTIGFAGDSVTYRRVQLMSAATGSAIFRTAYVPDGKDSLEMPRVIREVRPQMPRQARTKRPKYAVWVEAVVDENGDVAAARLLRRLEDSDEYKEEAMRVVHQWKFTPARLRGRPVPILVLIELTFTWE